MCVFGQMGVRVSRSAAVDWDVMLHVFVSGLSEQ